MKLFAMQIYVKKLKNYKLSCFNNKINLKIF